MCIRDRDNVVQSSSDMTIVHLSYLQDNGRYQDQTEIRLMSRAKFDESAMRSPSRAHMDWAHRLSSVGETDFRLSAHANPSSLQLSVPRRRDEAPAPTSHSHKRRGDSTLKQGTQTDVTSVG